MNFSNFYRALQEAVLPRAEGAAPVRMLLISGAEAMIAHGTVKPADGTAGYLRGALFMHTDGAGAGDSLYVNNGSATSCLFEPASSAKATIPIPIRLFSGFDGTVLAKYATGGSTPGFQTLGGKECVLSWDGHGTPGAVAVTIPMPQDLDDSKDVVVHTLARMAGATDTPVLAFKAYFNAGDSDRAGAAPEITGGTTLTEYTMTIAAAGVPASPSSLTVVLDPTDGEMATDELYVYACWLEYARKTLTA